MAKLTKEIEGIFYLDSSLMRCGEYGYAGEAVNRLAKFENIVDDLIKKQDAITKDMDQLRAEGKTNTIRFKQNLANKLLNSQILALFESYGCMK